eukprot:1811303-Pyramimonas_sp.AAC.1
MCCLLCGAHRRHGAVVRVGVVVYGDTLVYAGGARYTQALGTVVYRETGTQALHSRVRGDCGAHKRLICWWLGLTLVGATHSLHHRVYTSRVH